MTATATVLGYDFAKKRGMETSTERSYLETGGAGAHGGGQAAREDAQEGAGNHGGLVGEG